MTNNPATSHTTHCGEHPRRHLLPSSGDYQHGAPWNKGWLDNELRKGNQMNHHLENATPRPTDDKPYRAGQIAWIAATVFSLAFWGWLLT